MLEPKEAKEAYLFELKITEVVVGQVVHIHRSIADIDPHQTREVDEPIDIEADQANRVVLRQVIR